MKISHRRLGGAVAAFGVALTALTACGSGGDSADGTVELSFLVDNSETTLAQANAVADAFNATSTDVKVEVETRPQGTEGDNVVKTRLSTGDMSDVFWYPSGSLLQALNPAQSIADLTGDPVLKDVEEGFLPVVSQDAKVYGVPIGSGTGGGILYNRKVYAELGLQVPKTWAEFTANNDKIKAAGKTAVISTFKDSWSSQLLVLADFYNVQNAAPTFAQDYTANKAKFATTPAALTGFAHLNEVNAKGYQNKGFGSATVDQGMKLLLSGEGAHFPMLTFTLPPLLKDNPEAATDLGFFGVPGTDPAKAGATIWEPAAVYAAKDTEHLAEAKKFMAFVASPAGIDAIKDISAPTGPYRVKGAKLPDDAMQAVKDIQGYIDAGLTAPALEYLSPVKGPSLEQITVAVGSGLTPPAEGAGQYDKDVEKQAEQLGLAGW
ncbi:carbohydrate ABC transporter substrate-binding protein (CUT1 family) [Actinocorallia herbida]|uniref:Carbohydrate ABC transporter substrate-binding protein (CUT1 family) n=1 Tax=Actinocorallia herbida TaxID=58109 RepID=A0A3N1CXS8_9ACTN|nr:ABC transporter substrate-binding protein [Actinocorallia herbida]ROO86046.1 carbohydrate ABC transporter substrate-binding protein (CUT1 family) [Actinocorallia herbida]